MFTKELQSLGLSVKLLDIAEGRAENAEGEEYLNETPEELENISGNIKKELDKESGGTSRESGSLEGISKENIKKEELA